MVLYVEVCGILLPYLWSSRNTRCISTKSGHMVIRAQAYTQVARWGVFVACLRTIACVVGSWSKLFSLHICELQNVLLAPRVQTIQLCCTSANHHWPVLSSQSSWALSFVACLRFVTWKILPHSALFLASWRRSDCCSKTTKFHCMDTRKEWGA